MKALYIEVMSSQEALKRMARAWKNVVAEKQADATIGLGSIAELTNLLSPKRMELLRHVAQNPGLSVKKLAQDLGRDYKNVHTDVAELEARHLLARDTDGRIIAPYDQLVIRATLREAALFTSEDIHQAAFPTGVADKVSIASMKDGIRKHIRKRHAGEGSKRG